MAAIRFLLLPALAFAAIYYPVLKYFARGVVSPYAKADPWRRFYAAATDGALVTTAAVLFQVTGALGFLVLGAAYLAARDAVAGQSVGKWLFGLVVISLETRRPVTPVASVARNVMLVVPGANVAAIFLEAATIVRDPQGQRLGDLMVNTQVVEGYGAHAVVRALLDWWRLSLPDLTRPKPKRAPGTVGSLLSPDCGRTRPTHREEWRHPSEGQPT